MKEHRLDIQSSCGRLEPGKKDFLDWVRRPPANQIIWIFVSSLICVSLASIEASGAAVHQRLPPRVHNGAKDARHDSSDLDLGQPHFNELVAGQQHSYRLKLNAGQFAILTIDPTDIELVLAVIGPDGHRVVTISCPYGREAKTPVYIVARNTGFFRVSVRTVGESSPPGRYELLLAERRPATPKDRERAEAQRILAEGYKLLDTGGYRVPHDRAEHAVALFRKSSHLWKQAGDPRGEALSLKAIGSPSGIWATG